MPSAYPDNRRWWKLPETVRRAIVAGELTRSEVIVAVAIAAGAPWHSRGKYSGRRGRQRRRAAATVPWLVQRTGLAERTVWYALHGGRGRAGLLERWLDKDREHRYRWRSGLTARFARVTADELDALRSRPHLDAIRLWAWALGKLARGRPFVSWPFVPAEAAAALGWDSGRAWRAMWGARGPRPRLGACKVKLLNVVNGFMVERNPTELARRLERRRTCGQPLSVPCGSPVDLRSLRAVPLRVGELFQFNSGDKSPSLLVDLLHKWQRKVARHGGDPYEVAAADRHLSRLRRRRDRGRGWASSVLRRVLHATGFARRAAESGRRCAPSGAARPRGDPGL